jgi:hypothetical protein
MKNKPTLEEIKDQLPQYEEKKEMYKLRHFLHYHVIKKKKVNQKIEITKKDIKVSFD